MLFKISSDENWLEILVRRKLIRKQNAKVSFGHKNSKIFWKYEKSNLEKKTREKHNHMH